MTSRDEACSLIVLEGALISKLLIVTENVGANIWLIRTKDTL